jgi:hypothetical protein
MTVVMVWSQYATLASIAPGTVHELTEPDRLILDLETTTHTVAVLDALC